ncbi:LysM peptidoglycan-binding domain-containing protein [Devosia sp.]|uniref:LysM peptidoglycan-binding domain-containing protein n=1 Tax=Devosia sp. TaxID=1871048 RepID=UPI002FCB16E9
MGLCLRGKMADAGILPQQAPAASADAPAVATTEPAIAVGEPALDVTPPEDLIAATFGLLRAEPDGSIVIAGSGTPGSQVEIYSNGVLLGTATVESSGDWVFVPDAPIAPGGTEITLAEAGKPGRAAQSFVVVINDDKFSEPLVVASTPGAASEVLQGLDRPGSESPTQIAAVDPVAPASAPAAPAPATAPATQPAESPQAAAPPPVEPAAAPEPATAPESAPPATAEPAVPAPSEPAAVAAPAVEPAPTATPAAASPAPAADAPATAVAAADPAPVTPPAPAITFDGIPPTIDAIEIEDGRTFFAGAGPDGATMRLYVDDSFIADALVSAGRWLVEAGNVLTKPEQRVRIDMLQPDSAEVAARAEVDFVVDVPVIDAPPIAVAEAPAAAVPATEPVPAPQATEPAPATAATTEPAAVEPAPAEIAAATPAPVATPAVPTLIGVSIGGPDAERFAAGKAIIRRGDNLWTIARRVYGEGIKYTTIYQANTGQIRDPDRIYPGQVFELPN